jgi:hypothetical protein
MKLYVTSVPQQQLFILKILHKLTVHIYQGLSPGYFAVHIYLGLFPGYFAVHIYLGLSPGYFAVHIYLGLSQVILQGIPTWAPRLFCNLVCQGC